MSKPLTVLLAVGVMAVSACGGSKSSSSPTPVTPTPAPVVTAVVASGTYTGLDPFDALAIPFITTSTGTINAMVDWTDADCDIDVAIVRGTCTLDQINNDTCPYVTYSASETAKPERLTVPAALPASYTFYIFNLGPDTESLAYQVTLTTGGTAITAPHATTRGRLKGRVRSLVREGSRP